MSTRIIPGGLPRAVHRNLRQIRSTTWTLADAAGLRLAVCPPPERHDCDRDLGVVTRDAYPGETVRIPVTLKNRSGRHRVLALTADPLRGPGGDLAITPSLSPGTLDLLESQSGFVVIGLEVTDVLGPGSEYTSVITVSSKCCDPQELRLRLRVRPLDRAPSFPICCDRAERGHRRPCGKGPAPR